MKMYLIFIMAVISLGCVSKETEKTKTENNLLSSETKENKLDTVQENTYQLFSFEIGENFVAISHLPGKVNLAEDIAKIKANGVTNVVTLVSKEELENKNLSMFFDEMQKAGLEVYHSPIIDFGLPSEGQMDSIMAYVQSCVDNNKNVLIHCMGGYGRSGTVMGCYAHKYLNVDDPINYVREIRGEDAIETEEQEAFVLNY